jgi:hypothetical protein
VDAATVSTTGLQYKQRHADSGSDDSNEDEDELGETNPMDPVLRQAAARSSPSPA